MPRTFQNPPPLTTPILGPDGELSPVWRRYFAYLETDVNTLYAGAGGGGGGGLADTWQVFPAASGVVTPNHATANLFLVEAAGDVTINEPTGLRDGVRVLLKIRQDASGGRAVTLDAWWPQDIDAITSAGAELCIWGYVRGSAFELEGFRQL